MAEEPRPQFYIDLARGMGKDIGPQPVQRHVEDRDRHQADRDDFQGRQALMHQHLVHHNLKEQGRDQCEQLDEQRNDEDFQQYPPVLDHRRHEPAEIELGQLAEY